MDALIMEASNVETKKDARRALVIGVGNPHRHDDQVGLYVARRLREESDEGIEVREADGDMLDLMEMWQAADLVFVVDAVAGDSEPGNIYRFEICQGMGCSDRIPDNVLLYSTHAFGLGDAVCLAQNLGKLPPRLVIFGIEAEHFEPGEGLSLPVVAAAERVLDEIRDFVRMDAGPRRR